MRSKLGWITKHPQLSEDCEPIVKYDGKIGEGSCRENGSVIYVFGIKGSLALGIITVYRQNIDEFSLVSLK